MSLLLFVGSLLVWGLSHSHVVQFTLRTNDVLTIFDYDRGMMEIKQFSGKNDQGTIWTFSASPPMQPWNSRSFTAYAARQGSKSQPFLGIRFNRVGKNVWGLATPIRWIVLLSAIPPLLWILRYRGRRLERIKKGLCLKCGYDLQGSPNACPECGTERIQKSSNKKTQQTQ